jgi:NAD(P)-dependent dehydrogenase (short-subunit alcohol dehydrogenase family)
LISANTNLKAMLFLSQAALRVMKEKRRGYIFNVSSTAALQVPSRAAGYGTSKLGVVGLTQALYELGKDFGVNRVVIREMVPWAARHDSI